MNTNNVRNRDENKSDLFTYRGIFQSRILIFNSFEFLQKTKLMSGFLTKTRFFFFFFNATFQNFKWSGIVIFVVRNRDFLRLSGTTFEPFRSAKLDPTRIPSRFSRKTLCRSEEVKGGPEKYQGQAVLLIRVHAPAVPGRLFGILNYILAPPERGKR